MWPICSAKKIRKSLRRFARQFDELLGLMADLADAVRSLRAKPDRLFVVGGQLTFDFPGHVSITSELQPEEFMANRTITLPATHEDVRFALAPINELRDAEGSLITDFEEKFESSDPDVVALTFDDPAVLSAGSVHFGVPGVAVVVHSVATKVGRETLTSVLDTTTFVSTPGAPLVVTGGEASFEGLDADPETPPPTE